MAAIEPFTDGYVHFGTEHTNLRLGSKMDGIESGMTPTQRGAGANMSIDVASGYFWIAQTRYTYAGGNVVVSAAHASLNRWDVVYANSGGVGYTAGTATVTPTMPVLGAGQILIAAIYVTAGTSAITDSVIRDERVMTVVTNTLSGTRIADASLADTKLADDYLKLLYSDNTIASYAAGTGKTASLAASGLMYVKIIAAATNNGNAKYCSVAVEGTEVAFATTVGSVSRRANLIVEGSTYDGTNWCFISISDTDGVLSLVKTNVTLSGAMAITFNAVTYTVALGTFMVYGNYP
jgi:hypothetical protein